jgi:hypothetical protein
LAQATGFEDGGAEVVAGGLVERDAAGDVGGVVADAALGDGWPKVPSSSTA